jgi:formin 2
LNAVDSLNEHSISQDNLESLIRNWPGDEFDGLMEEYARDKTAKWEKAEDYFIKLGSKPKFELRLKVWMFKLKFDKTVKMLSDQIETVTKAFNTCVKNEHWLALLGAILKFGNCLNAGEKKRGQADGFLMGNL